MKIKDILKERTKGISLEFFPPKSAEGKDSFMKVFNALKRYNPLYVSVTYGAGGSTQDRTSSTLKWIKQETDITVMSHLTCIGATQTAMDVLLRDYITHDIDNILALRGDPPKGTKDFDPTKAEFRYAKDLVEFIKKYNSFSIAVAVYPEGHPESLSIEEDIGYTKEKIDAGADFAITQMFFDNRYYYDFIERAEKRGIKIPILPGIMPITDFKKIKEFASFCKATIPKDIEEKMVPLINKQDEMFKLGIEHAIKQCADLINNGIKYLHFYTLNKSEAFSTIIDGLGLPSVLT